jgi:hypothetical protein
MSHIIYEGPSVIDGKPIVAVLTGTINPSRNSKTGPMLQTTIIRSDISPNDAVKQKEDASVCGGCPHRGSSCYVNVGHGPRAVFDAYKRGLYVRDNLTKLGRNRAIRLGSYGDPAAVPIEVWDKLLVAASMFTGYTHSPSLSPGLARYAQASADTPEQARLLQGSGWRTFRVKTAGELLERGEVLCPSNKGVQCISCGLCNGQQRNVAIDVHGTKGKVGNYEKWRAG